MVNTRKCLNILAGLVALTAVGCMPELTIEMMKEMKPERPSELDKLNLFVGTWETTSEMNFPGMDEPMTGTGTMTAEWDVDRWVLSQHGEFHMGEMGTMHGLELITWDASSKKFRTVWHDNFGTIGHGSAKPCSCCGTHWKMKAMSSGPWGTMFAAGGVDFIGDNKSEWTWSEWPWWDVFRLFQVDMTGTSTRK